MTALTFAGSRGGSRRWLVSGKWIAGERGTHVFVRSEHFAEHGYPHVWCILVCIASHCYFLYTDDYSSMSGVIFADYASIADISLLLRYASFMRVR